MINNIEFLVVNYDGNKLTLGIFEVYTYFLVKSMLKPGYLFGTMPMGLVVDLFKIVCKSTTSDETLGPVVIF